MMSVLSLMAAWIVILSLAAFTAAGLVLSIRNDRGLR